jgi:hypothetical protein
MYAYILNEEEHAVLNNKHREHEESRRQEAERKGVRFKPVEFDLKLETKKSKGTARAVVKKYLKIQDYRSTLYSGVSMRHGQIGFRSVKQRLYTQAVTKISLSALDTKRYILEDKISSRAFGYTKPLCEADLDEILGLPSAPQPAPLSGTEIDEILSAYL